MLRRSWLRIATPHTSILRPKFRERLSDMHRQPSRPRSVDETAAEVWDPRRLVERRRGQPAVLLAEAERAVDDAVERVSSSDRAMVLGTLEAVDEASVPAVASANRWNVAARTATKTEDAGAEDVAWGPDDDDIVLGEDDTLLAVDSAGRRSAVPKDAVDLVTDEFARLREKEARRRRKVLYDLMHPDPMDYTYAGKLVPVPPLSFGKLTPEAHALGQAMFTHRPYRLVKQANADQYFFEINDYYTEIVFLGRANAGKSSLINALVGGDVAKTSSLPHSTRSINFYQNVSPDELANFGGKNPNKLVKLPGGGKQFTLVDVPGFGIDGMSDQWRDDAIRLTDSYMGLRRSVNTAFVCIDADKGLTPRDHTIIDWMARIHGLVWVVVTKADAVPHTRLCDVMRRVYEFITKYRRKHRNVYPFVLPVSAQTGENVDALRALIVETSGIVPGDKVRELLRKKSADALLRARESEAQRLARNELDADNTEVDGLLPNEPSATQTPKTNDAGVDIDVPGMTEADYKVPASTRASPYSGHIGGLVFPHKVSVGADGSQELQMTPSAEVDPSTMSKRARRRLAKTMAQAKRKAAGAASSTASSDNQEGGPVSARIRDPGAQHVTPLDTERKRRSKGTCVLVEQSDGSVTGIRGGKRVQVEAPKPLADRVGAGGSAQWARDVTEGPIASGMTPAEWEAYNRNNGGVRSTGEKQFWDGVDSRNFEHDARRNWGIRREKEMEVGQGTRLSFGAMPRGGLKKYGRRPDNFASLPGTQARSTSNIKGL